MDSIRKHFDGVWRLVFGFGLVVLRTVTPGAKRAPLTAH
jgi:hypothetical protein